MEFAEMRDLLIEHFEQMTEDTTHLFTCLVDKEEMYNLYLDSFPEGTNEIFRTNREFDCSCCRGFIKSVGNVVAIKDNKVETIWDFGTGDEKFDVVLKTLSNYIKSHSVTDVWFSVDKKVGSHHNFEMIELVGQKQWDHFFLEIPDKYMVPRNKSKGDILGDFRDTRNVFKRSLDEITIEALDSVLDLISDNNLYKGDEWKSSLTNFRKFKKSYEECEDKELFAWETSVKVGPVIGRIRNHSIGTLLVNISEGMDLETAVKKYDQITAPSNYKRSKPIYTQAMLDKAQKDIEELGYMDSLQRRFATLDDLTVRDILYSNKDAAKRIKDANDIFGELSKAAKGKKKMDNDRIKAVNVETFLSEILPSATDIKLYLENSLESNLVSLIASKNKDSKSMFKWNNNISWAYHGNMTDSMKERVKAAGGDVTGDLRFSIQWNEEGIDNCDLDAHCIEPDAYEIYYGNKGRFSNSHGMLDVDIISPGRAIAVENITYSTRTKMKDGKYTFLVNQYSGSVKKGFRAEIEFDGQIYSFDYPNSMRSGENVVVAEVTLTNGNFTIKEKLPSSMSTKNIWNISTNDFVPVSVVCYSPNHWENSNKTGHKHLFFMLADCINDENPSGMFNEFLVQELYEHRKVMEALASRMRVEDSTDQLSGVGFALDKRSSVVLKVDDEMIKIEV